MDNSLGIAEEVCVNDFDNIKRQHGISASFESDLTNGIGMYSTVLLRGKENGEWCHAGSATLVRFGDFEGLLTAGHVADVLKKGSRLGLAVMAEEHLFSVDMSHVEMHSLYDPGTDGPLPDISLIRLPHEDVVSIEAREKLLYNVKRNKEQILGSAVSPERCAWAVAGAAEENKTIELSSREPGVVESFFCQVGMTSVDPIEEVEGFDGLAAFVDYNSKMVDAPSSFRGCSGGGLWRLDIKKDDKGEYVLRGYCLAGVLCLESPVEGGSRKIVCHGPRGMVEYFERVAG